MVALWGESQSAISPFCSTFSYAQWPLGLHLNPLSPIWLAFAGLKLHAYVWFYSHNLSAFTTNKLPRCRYSFLVPLVLSVIYNTYISRKDFSVKGVSIKCANICHTRKYIYIGPRGNSIHWMADKMTFTWYQQVSNKMRHKWYQSSLIKNSFSLQFGEMKCTPHNTTFKLIMWCYVIDFML